MDSPGKTRQGQPKSSPAATSNGQSGFRFDYDSGGLPVENFPSARQGVAPPDASLQNEGGQNAKTLWLRRLSLALFVIVCVEVGLVLVVFPWTHVWTDNALLIKNVALRSLAMHNFVRGIVTGLGLINVWMGISEAVYYRDRK